MGNQDLADDAAVGPGLVGHKGLTEHFLREVAGLAGGFAEMDTAFEAIGERAFTAPSGVDLGFDDEVVRAERSGNAFGLLGGGSDAAGRVRNPEFVEEFLGLVFVDVHSGASL